MRIRASDGKQYDPEKCKVLDKRELPDGKTETLMRTINGSYFLYTTPEPKIRGRSITPMNYDNALNWIDNYSSRDKVDGVMIFSEEKNGIHITISDSVNRTIKHMSSVSGETVQKIVSEAIIAYAKHLEETKE